MHVLPILGFLILLGETLCKFLTNHYNNEMEMLASRTGLSITFLNIDSVKYLPGDEHHAINLPGDEYYANYKPVALAHLAKPKSSKEAEMKIKHAAEFVNPRYTMELLLDIRASNGLEKEKLVLETQARNGLPSLRGSLKRLFELMPFYLRERILKSDRKGMMKLRDSVVSRFCFYLAQYEELCTLLDGTEPVDYLETAKKHADVQDLSDLFDTIYSLMFDTTNILKLNLKEYYSLIDAESPFDEYYVLKLYEAYDYMCELTKNSTILNELKSNILGKFSIQDDDFDAPRNLCNIIIGPISRNHKTKYFYQDPKTLYELYSQDSAVLKGRDFQDAKSKLRNVTIIDQDLDSQNDLILRLLDGFMKIEKGGDPYAFVKSDDYKTFLRLLRRRNWYVQPLSFIREKLPKIHYGKIIAIVVIIVAIVALGITVLVIYCGRSSSPADKDEDNEARLAPEQQNMLELDETGQTLDKKKYF
jgi:hypothetical protein